jgi:thymidine kinase
MSLHLILGPMYSGKTSDLIRLADRYKIAKKKVIIVKYLADTRYSKDELAAHSGTRVLADASTDRLSLVDFEPYDVICVDEVQFYPDNKDLIKWADKGKIVVASGLSGNYLRHQFQGIPELISAADRITHLNSVCMLCNNENGSFSAMRKEQTQIAGKAAETEFIGGQETYVALCRKCYVNSQ